MKSIKVLKVINKSLPCKLTNDELLVYGSELASTVQDIKSEEDRQVSVKQEMKARITKLESERTILSSKIGRKEEDRDVDVEPCYDYNKNMYIERRLDTDEIIFERALFDDERQEEMNIEE